MMKKNLRKIIEFLSTKNFNNLQLCVECIYLGKNQSFNYLLLDFYRKTCVLRVIHLIKFWRKQSHTHTHTSTKLLFYFLIHDKVAI